MRYTKVFLRSVVLFGVVLFSVYTVQAEDLVGTWNGKMHIPNFGPYEMTMVLEKTDAGYKGKVSDTSGWIAEGTEIEDFKVDNNQLYGSFKLTDNSVVYLSLTADGDTIIGQAEREGGIVSCVFVREDKLKHKD